MSAHLPPSAAPDRESPWQKRGRWLRPYWLRSASYATLLLALHATARASDTVDYRTQIKPILRTRCYACHGVLKQESGLRLDSAALIRKGGDSGAVIEPGKPEQSALIERIASGDEFVRMPPEGEPLTKDEIRLLWQWIEQGAVAPANEQAEEDPRSHWAFRTPSRPTVPNDEQAAHYQNAIDAFIEHRLAQKKLAPAPAAERHVLLRRVYLDLVGLPPTQDELQAFLNDESPDAYAKVVDRLLSMPQYGERWGRHWMDVWRYSDWHGRRHVPDVWNSAPQIWRWRDWIVRSLNEDKDYDQMVREMLAADEIAPEDPTAAVATGYLIRNWYALNPNDWMRNTVEHVGKAFLGLTFNCAHCHDHKYDPISQEDYFRLRAFFEPMYVRQDRVAGEADPGPFQDYDYSTLRKIQRLGLVRVFDKNPAAPTWFYTGGDERNRVTERGSIAPGVPAILASAGQPEITPVALPPRVYYPGLQPAIQQTVLADAKRAVAEADTNLAAARQADDQVGQHVVDRFKQAESAYAAAVEKAKATGTLTALAGKQSLVFDATEGRRILNNRLAEIEQLHEGTKLRFQLLLATDAHFNFQLAKDADEGLTAGYVAFEGGRIVAYQPGSFTEFETGRYDFAGGQRRFLVELVIRTGEDQCLLTVRSLADDVVLCEGVPVALNGWNPIGDATKAITFDAHTGSIAAIDEVSMSIAKGDADRLIYFDFESPDYPETGDVVGHYGWEASSFCVAPATSFISTDLSEMTLAGPKENLETARRALRAPALRVAAAECQLVAANAKLASVEARIAADRARYEEIGDADVEDLTRTAAQLERDATLRATEAQALASEHALAVAEGLPSDDANRAKQIEATSKQFADARAALEKARTEADAESDEYSPLSPVYPSSSTGRRTALGEWITSTENPLAARVAVNHVWMRHFHAPLVSTVFDFGRNGATPIYPELLDWLAVEFMESGWSMKHLHRLIVTSDAYRRVSSVGEVAENLSIDPDNKYLWRMNAGRMESEVVRDSLLYVGGRLQLEIGGQELETEEALKTYRRSLYYCVHPEQGGRGPLGELFDGPSAVDCYRRTRSIVPQQALALTNSDLVHDTSAALVDDWMQRASAASSPAEFVADMFQRILTRRPTRVEQDVCLAAFDEQLSAHEAANSEDAETMARRSLVRALLNHNDFITIR